MADTIPRKLILELIEKNFSPTDTFAPKDLLSIVRTQLESKYPTIENIDHRIRAHLFHLVQAGILNKTEDLRYTLAEEYPHYSEEPSVDGTVYILKDLLKGGYKIGVSRTIKNRLKQLEVGTKAEVVGLWNSINYTDLERMLHGRYAKYRIPQSEWFALSYDDLLDAVDWLDTNATQVECHLKRKKFKPNYPTILTEMLLIATVMVFTILYVNHKIDMMILQQSTVPIAPPTLLDLP